MSVELGHLRHFHAVASTGSFTRAARDLRISQSAVSKIISLLEDARGEALFVRKRGGVELTAAGRTLHERTRRIFEIVAEIDSGSGDTGRGNAASASIAIGVSDNLANYVVPAALGALRSRFPNSRVKIVAGTSDFLRAKLATHEIEAAVTYYVRESTNARTSRIGAVRFALVTARDSATKRFADAAAVDAPWIGSVVGDYAQPNPATELLARAGLRPDLAIECNQLETQKRCALEGLGCALLPAFMVREELRSGSLREIATPRPLTHPVTWAARRSGTETAFAREFRDELVRTLKRAN